VKRPPVKGEIAPPQAAAHPPFFRSADIFVQSRGSDLLLARKP